MLPQFEQYLFTPFAPKKKSSGGATLSPSSEVKAHGLPTPRAGPSNQVNTTRLSGALPRSHVSADPWILEVWFERAFWDLYSSRGTVIGGMPDR